MPAAIHGRVRRDERGSSAVEFAFCSLILLPLLLGGLSVGFNLVRATQVAQFTRDAGHQYAYGIDFTQSSGQQLLVRLATGLNFQLNGGTGVAIFSTILMVGPNDCTAGGLQANTGSCPNLKCAVYTRWYRVGNTAVFTSTLGNPTTANVSTGILNSSSYLKDSSARASGISNLMTLAAGQSIYVTEVYFSSSDYNITGFLTGNGVYARAIF
jgi:hypothetical protein